MFSMPDMMRKLYPVFFKSFNKVSEDMWLLVGLGNPGDKYAGNRHNVGFMAIDQIASDYTFPAFRSKFDGLLSEGRIKGQKVALLKPQTFMNDSGRSVGQALRFFKVTPNRVIVFYDELDLPPFKVKVKKGGGTAGHNGLKSIDAHLNRADYWKVRLGIGHPGDRNRVSGYVLSDFSKEEQQSAPQWIDAVAKYTPLLLEDNQADFMTRLAEYVK
jgi:PTH1 family peptidyl-tRNA hydrolase